MKILLIDLDSKIPNLALMKLATFHKSLGDKVDLVRHNVSYYPKKIEKNIAIPNGYDCYYCSILFPKNKHLVLDERVVMGGSGYDLAVKLPDEIENLAPDYSIYADNNTSYGFLTRGCSRSCRFCLVPRKEGKIRRVNTIDDIVKHKKVKFLDNNILIFPDHKALLRELVEKRIRCCFTQGLDIRCVDVENSKLLAKLNYSGEYTFAFDSWRDLPKIKRGLKLLNWAEPWQLRFFVYCNANEPLPYVVKRVDFLKSNSCLPYLMRDVNCWDSPICEFYTDLAAYCNQPGIFKKNTFRDFLEKRHVRQDRIEFSWLLYCAGLS